MLLLITLGCGGYALLVTIVTSFIRDKRYQLLVLATTIVWGFKLNILQHDSLTNSAQGFLLLDFLATALTILLAMRSQFWWMLWLAIVTQLHMIADVVMLIWTDAHWAHWLFDLAPSLLFVVQLTLLIVPWWWKMQRRFIASRKLLKPKVYHDGDAT